MVCVIRVMRTKRVSVIFNSIFLVPVNHETSLSIVCIYVYTVCATTVYSFLVLFILLCVTYVQMCDPCCVELHESLPVSLTHLNNHAMSFPVSFS